MKYRKPTKFGLGGGRHKVKRCADRTGRPTYNYIYTKLRQRNPLKARKVKLSIKIKRIRVYNKFKKHMPKDVIEDVSRKFDHLTPRLSTQSGYRIMEMEQVDDLLTDIATHMCTCKEAIKLVEQGIRSTSKLTELNCFGIASTVGVICQGCKSVFRKDTSKRLNCGYVYLS